MFQEQDLSPFVENNSGHSDGVPRGDDPDQAAVVRFWCTRPQARRMAHWAAEVISRGRPICPQCGEPIEADGHFCPKKNGHKRK